MHQVVDMAERMRFELTIQCYSYNGLAILHPITQNTAQTQDLCGLQGRKAGKSQSYRAVTVGTFGGTKTSDLAFRKRFPAHCIGKYNQRLKHDNMYLCDFDIAEISRCNTTRGVFSKVRILVGMK